MASKAISATAAILGVAVVSGAAWWLLHKPPAPDPERASAAPAVGVASRAGGPPTLVTIAIAVRQDVPVVVEINGSVVSLNTVDVRPQVSNMVQKVHVKEGQFVRAGEPLFTLDDRADRANVEKAQAQQLRDQALLAGLEQQYKRSQELLAQNFISRSAAEAALSQVEAQRAALASDAAAARGAQVALSYDSIRAPISGRIGTIAVYAGSLAQPATTMLTVTQLDPIAVSFPVPEGRLQDLLAAARNRAAVMASVAGSPVPLQGVLSFVDNTVDPQVGTVKAKAQFGNASQLLWPGQYVKTRITVRTLKDAILLPQAAVITSASGKIVYIVAQDDTVQPRKIEIDYPFGDQVALRGLLPGERVVVEGKQNLRPGSRVRVEKSGKAEPAKKDPT